MPAALIDIPDTPYSYFTSDQRLVDGIAERVKNLRESGKLTPDVLYRIRKYFRLKDIYHSNAIEGNVLDIGETRQVVELGLTLTGKPLKDQAEARNLSEAIDYLEQLASQPAAPIREIDIRNLHTFVLKGIDDSEAGAYRTIPVEISGSKYRPPAPEDVPPKMAEFGRWLAAVSVPGDDFATAAGLLRATVAHTWLVSTHPFVDGNGRASRLLMNLVLMRYGYPIAIITREDRARYYDALEESQTSDLTPFINLVCESLHESLDEYERAAQEHREQLEWARSLIDRFTEEATIKIRNEYEVWKNAMDLLKSYFRQTSYLIDEQSLLLNVFFKDFGNLEFEKYLSLRYGESVKRTWFFRIDFRRGESAARYLFFFGRSSPALHGKCDVTLHVAREEQPYYYERLEQLTAPNVPSLVELGYRPHEERFLARFRTGQTRLARVEQIGKEFIDEVFKMHFSTNVGEASSAIGGGA